jgi:hypothetical protein
MPTLLLALQVLALPADGPVLSHAAEPLRDAIAAVCGPNLQQSPDDLLRREAQLSREHPTDAASLRALACLRGVLAGEGLTGKEGYLMPAGESWRSGSLAANAKLLEQNPGDSEALRLLAAILLDDPLAEEARRWAPTLVDGVLAGAADPAVLRACAVLHLGLREYAEARRCAERGLREGTDSTTNFLVVARERFAAHDTTLGVWAFRQAVAAARDPRAVAEITWHVTWFLSPSERATWDTLPAPTRPAWLMDRLVARDIRDGRARDARLAEHFARLEHVMGRFAMQVTPMMRKRILSGMSVSDKVAFQPMPDVDVTTDDFGSGLNYREYRRWQVDFDDRGVVWMRFGKPDEMTVYMVPYAGDYRVFEAWKYRIDDETIILTFESEEGDGTGEATRLVTGRYGEYYCGFDIYRCTLANRAQSAARFNAISRAAGEGFRMGITPAQIGTLREADVEQIVEATTKDDNSVRASRHITTNAQYLRLWEPTTGRAIALMPYAVRTQDLERMRVEGQPAVIFQLSARSWDPVREVWHDTTVVRRLRVPERAGNDARLTGLLTVPRSDDVSAWSVIVAQDTTARGRAFGDAIRPLGSGAIVHSDLVLGAARQGQSWQSGTGPVVLAPLGTFSRAEPVELYYQVRSAEARPGARTSVALYRIQNGERSSEPALELTFGTALDAGITEVRRSLDVSRLDEGTYFIDVRVVSAGMSSVQGSRLELRR